jgi:hypothetical protein
LLLTVRPLPQKLSELVGREFGVGELKGSGDAQGSCAGEDALVQRARSQ